MKITDIKIRKLCDDEKMKAVVSVTFDDQLVLHDIKVINGAEKLFIAMPSRKITDGKYVDISHPITPQFREEMETAVLAAYSDALERAALEATQVAADEE